MARPWWPWCRTLAAGGALALLCFAPGAALAKAASPAPPHRAASRVPAGRAAQSTAPARGVRPLAPAFGSSTASAVAPAAVSLSPQAAWSSPAAAAAASSAPGAQSAASVSPQVADAAVQELQGLDTSGIQGFVDALNRQLGPNAGFSWQNLNQFLHGKGLLRHPGQLVGALLGVFTAELRGSLRLLGQLLILVVFAAVLRQIQGAFEGETVARVADAAIFLALGAICLAGFALAVRLAQGAISDLASFIIALLPALIGLLAATGAPTTAGLLQPALVAALDGVGVVMRGVVFPLLLLAALLDIVGAFSPQFKLTSLASLMRQIGTGLMGLLLTVFLGVVAVQGAAGAIADGVGLRAAKYATKAFIPVVGGLFADAAEIVLSSSFLLKSGLGLIGLLVCALLVAVPVMKMMALWLIYRLSAAVAQPVGGEGIAQVLGGVASTLSLLTMAVAAVGLMSFLSLSVLVGAGTAAFALR